MSNVYRCICSISNRLCFYSDIETLLGKWKKTRLSWSFNWFCVLYYRQHSTVPADLRAYPEHGVRVAAGRTTGQPACQTTQHARRGAQRERVHRLRHLGADERQTGPPPLSPPVQYCIVSSQTSLHLFSWKLVSRNGFESRKTVFSLVKSLVLKKSFLQTFWFASLKKVLNSFHIKFRKGFSGKIYSMFNIFIQPIWIMAWWHLLADFIKSFDIWIWSPNTSPMLTVGY